MQTPWSHRSAPEARVCAPQRALRLTEALITFTALSAISRFLNKENKICVSRIMGFAASAQSSTQRLTIKYEFFMVKKKKCSIKEVSCA